MSQLINPIARYAQSGEINFQIEDKDGALAELKKTFGPPTHAAQIDDMDGVTIDCFKTEGWWCNVRKSNTEPLLRLNLEAKDRPTLDRMLAQIAPRLGRRVEH
jgi:phosphomannomutase